MARAGRTGRALSLLTRDELPYLLDLHLFLSRPLQPAPVVPLAEARKAADCLDVASSLYGSFPQVPDIGVTQQGLRLTSCSWLYGTVMQRHRHRACYCLPEAADAAFGASWAADMPGRQTQTADLSIIPKPSCIQQYLSLQNLESFPASRRVGGVQCAASDPLPSGHIAADGEASGQPC